MSAKNTFFYRKRPARFLHLCFKRSKSTLKTFGKRSADVRKTKYKRSENDKWAPGLTSTMFRDKHVEREESVRGEPYEICGQNELSLLEAGSTPDWDRKHQREMVCRRPDQQLPGRLCYRLASQLGRAGCHRRQQYLFFGRRQTRARNEGQSVPLQSDGTPLTSPPCNYGLRGRTGSARQQRRVPKSPPRDRRASSMAAAARPAGERSAQSAISAEERLNALKPACVL